MLMLRAIGLALSLPPEDGSKIIACSTVSGRTRYVTVDEFSHNKCMLTFAYFQALDSLEQRDYVRLRDGLPWAYDHTFTCSGESDTTKQHYDLSSDVSIERTYSPTEIVVTIENRGAGRLFVEGQDIGNDIALAYTAIPAKTTAWIYKIKVPNNTAPWPKAQMHIRYMVLK